MKHSSEKKVYFTALVPRWDTGFTDQLTRFMAMRKLGLSLGYTYLHTPMASGRTERVVIEGPRWPLQRLYLRALRVYYKYLTGNSHYNPHHLLGLNEYFASQEVGYKPCITDLKVVEVDLSGAFLARNNISTLEGLQRWIKKAVLQEEASGHPLLVRLILPIPIGAALAMLASIPATTDGLDLRAIYSERRRKHPWKSKFPRGRVKTLVHIRLGDKAAFKTPWNTWFYFNRRPHPQHPQLGMRATWETARGENEFKQLTVVDFHDFVQGLTSRFADGTFAMVFSSDGFGGTAISFRDAWFLASRRRITQRITKEQLNILSKHLWRYNRQFKVLRSIKNSVSIIGETPVKFFHFFHSCLTADLVITAFPVQHFTVWNLMTLYAGSGDTPVMPVVILLYKPGAQKELRDFLVKNSKYAGKIIPVNIAAPDFDQIIARLSELLPDLDTPTLMVPSNAPGGRQ